MIRRGTKGTMGKKTLGQYDNGEMGKRGKWTKGHKYKGT